MLFKTSLPMIDTRGTPIRNPAGDFTTGSLAVEVLLGIVEDPLKVTTAEKARRYRLAYEILHAGEAIDLPVEDIVLLKMLVDKGYPAPMISAQFAILVDPTHKDSENAGD